MSLRPTLFAPGLAALLLAGAAAAQPAPQAGPPVVRQGGADHGDPSARMEAERAKRMSALHTLLRLRPNQEAAWTRWTQETAMTRADWEAERDPATSLETMTTPQRLDALQRRLDQHTATFRRRADATRAFYAQLSPDQQKSFDAAEELGGPGHHHRGRLHGRGR